MGFRRMLASLAGASLLATAVAVIGFGGAAEADTPNGQVIPVSGSIGGLFTDVMCLDVKIEDGYYSPNARIQQWECTGGNEEQFHAHPYALVGTSWGSRWVYQWVNLRSGQCMEVRDGALGKGAQIDQFPCATGGVVNSLNARQLWLETRLNASPYYIVQPWSALSAGLNMCLDVSNSSHDNGAKIQQWTCNGTDAQLYVGDVMVNDGAVVG